MDNEPEFEPDDGPFDGEPTREELAVWLSEFMNKSADAEMMYRSHFCSLVVNRVFSEFGYEGMCELLMSIDKQAGWITDIILENNDIDDILFKKFGVYDREAIRKARETEAMGELNQKIWRLRKKYSKLISDEIMGIVPEPKAK